MAGGTGTSTTTTTAALPEPFPVAPPPNPGFAASPTLQALLEDKIKKSKTPNAFKHMSFALVDLTRASSTPGKASSMDYAGINDEKEQRAFSLAKIGVMFAAFRLRERVRAAASGLAAKDAGDLFQQLSAGWQRKIETRLP